MSLADHTDVALHMATLLVAEQYEAQLSAYNSHISTLQDCYWEEQAERWNFFDLSCRLTTPMVPLGAEQTNSMAEKSEKLLQQYSASLEAEVAEFRIDSEVVRTELANVVAKAEAQLRTEAQKHQDEFFATSMLCRREVSSTVAMLKSEYSVQQATKGGMDGLQRALDIATGELELLRSRYDAVTNEQGETLAQLRGQLQAEREKNRSTVATERDELADRIRGVLAQSEAERTSHLTEMTTLHSNHMTAVERMRVHLEERTAEVDAGRAEAEECRHENLNLVKAHTLEKVELQKLLTELQCENARLKATLSSQTTENQLELESLEFHVHQRKQQEVEEFKRRLVMQGTGGAAGGGGYRSGSSMSEVGQQPTRANGDTFFSAKSRSGSLPYSARGASPNAANSTNMGYDPSLIGATSPLSPRAQQQATQNILAPYRAASTMSTPRSNAGSTTGARESSASITANLRSPSETYLKLQNISSSWRDRLASSN